MRLSASSTPGSAGSRSSERCERRCPTSTSIYLGDTARVPYGTKGPATVIKYALACSRHMVSRGVKALVVACNTVSAVAPERLRVKLDIPVLGVVEPGARAAVAATRTGRIGVLRDGGDNRVRGVPTRGRAALDARRGHRAARAAPRAARRGRLDRAARCRDSQSVAIWSPSPERGRRRRPRMHALSPAARAHRGRGARAHRPDVAVVDSAHATAQEVQSFLFARELARVPSSARPTVQLLVTDVPGAFPETAARFLGDAVRDVEQIESLAPIGFTAPIGDTAPGVGHPTLDLGRAPKARRRPSMCWVRIRTAAVCLNQVVARPKSRIGHPTPVALRRARRRGASTQRTPGHPEGRSLLRQGRCPLRLTERSGIDPVPPCSTPHGSLR